MKIADKISYYITNYFQNTGYEIVLPNFYFGPYEMDVFRRMKNGYINEYEIKISRADFKKDFEKSHKKFHQEFKNGTFSIYDHDVVLKHEEFSKGKGVPNKFWFVVPEGLISIDEVPDYAGLIYWIDKYDCTKIIKPAKFIHKNVHGRIEFYNQLLINLSFREMNHRNKLIRYKNQIKSLKQNNITKR